MQTPKLITKALTHAILIIVLTLPAGSLAQKKTLQGDANRIELTRETEFVVRMMEVVDRSGNRIKGLVELDSFDNDKKVFTFKKAGGKIQKVSHKEIKQIVFNRLRQGVLTGKPQSLRVIAWNGKTKNIVVNYRGVKIKNGYLFLNQEDLFRHFDDADRLKTGSYEWSEKLHNFWQRKKAQSPEVFSTNFSFVNGRGIISRRMAAAYCRTCVNIEILRLKIDPLKETLSIRCKDVFYDKYNE